MAVVLEVHGAFRFGLDDGCSAVILVYSTRGQPVFALLGCVDDGRKCSSPPSVSPCHSLHSLSLAILFHFCLSITLIPLSLSLSVSLSLTLLLFINHCSHSHPLPLTLSFSFILLLSFSFSPSFLFMLPLSLSFTVLTRLHSLPFPLSHNHECSSFTHIHSLFFSLLSPCPTYWSLLGRRSLFGGGGESVRRGPSGDERRKGGLRHAATNRRECGPRGT